MRIRKASQNDFAAIIAIQKNDGYDHHYYLTVDRLKRLRRRGEVFFVAIVDGQLAGFAGVDFEQRARLHFLCVLTQYQKRGIGSALMRRMLRETVGRGHKSAHSYVESPSSKEVFLAKQGFAKVGFYQDRYGLNKHASIWQIQLN